MALELNIIKLIAHAEDSKGCFRLSDRAARKIEQQLGYMPDNFHSCDPQQGRRYWLIDLRTGADRGKF